MKYKMFNEVAEKVLHGKMDLRDYDCWLLLSSAHPDSVNDPDCDPIADEIPYATNYLGPVHIGFTVVDIDTSAFNANFNWPYQQLFYASRKRKTGDPAQIVRTIIVYSKEPLMPIAYISAMYGSLVVDLDTDTLTINIGDDPELNRPTILESFTTGVGKLCGWMLKKAERKMTKQSSKQALLADLRSRLNALQKKEPK